MAAADSATRSQDRYSRLRPFAWMKRLANRKNIAAEKFRTHSKTVSNLGPGGSKKTRRWQTQPREDVTQAAYDDGQGLYGRQAERPLHSFEHGPQQMNGDGSGDSYRSIAPTVGTNQDTTISDGDRQSKAGTSNTLGGGVSTTSGGGNSIFTSPDDSTHSLTTTLTTIQSQATPSFPGQQHPQNHAQHSQHGSTYFSHQYPQTLPGSARSHLNPHNSHVPLTYRSATANNLLTDNASVLTLASSSHRNQRRNSLDTDASIRAIRPSSTWGGSRESLPLSVLSQNIEPVPGPAPPLPQPASRGLIRDERASVYSGVGAPMLSSERNSIYTGRTAGSVMDQGSVRSGRISHGRNDSTAGSFAAKENFTEGYVDGERSY